MDKSWVVSLEYDEETGDAILPLTDEIMLAAGWNLGDDIEWINNGDGSWSMKKVEKKQWVLVECIAQYRMRYMVEVPEGEKEWALDTVTMEDAKEFSQKYLGESIVSHRVVTEEEALALCDADNDYTNGKYGTPWTKEQKLNAFFTKDGEKVEK